MNDRPDDTTTARKTAADAVLPARPTRNAFSCRTKTGLRAGGGLHGSGGINHGTRLRRPATPRGA